MLSELSGLVWLKINSHKSWQSKCVLVELDVHATGNQTWKKQSQKSDFLGTELESSKL